MSWENNFRDLSIRWKVRGIIIVTVLTVTTVFGFSLVAYDSYTSRQAAEGQVAAMAALIGANTRAALAFGDQETGAEILKASSALREIRCAYLYDPTGGLFAKVEPAATAGVGCGGNGNPIRREPKVAHLSGAVYQSAPIHLGEDIVGYVEVVLALTQSEQRTQRFLLILGGIVIASLIVVILVARYLERPVTVPLARLSGAAQDVMSRQDYTLRVPETGNDEIGRLIKAFNAMLAQIEQRDRELVLHRDNLEQAVAERTEELVAARDAAEAASRAKSEFLSRTSHELRTPLNAILGFGQLLQIDFEKGPDTEHKQFVDQIVTSGRHLLDLINEVLDLAGIESGLIPLRTEMVALDPFVSQCGDLTRSLIGKKTITLHAPTRDTKLTTVLADPQRLRQILLNLLSNAVKYNREGGGITISVSQPFANRVRIAVIDTGSGIDPARQNEIFVPFARLGQEYSGIDGTGIGLTVCQRLAELMNGQIGFVSKLGEGSTFWVDLPAGTDEPSLPPAPARFGQTSLQPLSDGTAIRLLHVEDNSANRDFLRSLLDRFDRVELVEASNGQEAIDAVLDEQPNIILMDIGLPDMTGIELIAILRSIRGMQRIPVIAISAHAHDQNIAEAEQAGFHAYLTKPVEVEPLLDCLAKTIAEIRPAIDQTSRVGEVGYAFGGTN